MNTLLIIFLVVLLGGAVTFLLMKTGKIADKDGNNIPDAIEDTAQEAKRRAQRIFEELGDVGNSIKEVARQTGDIVDAAKGEKRKGRKRKSKQ
jgi:F0F1-type ATP synthase membrane subunit b/b'